VSDSVFTEDTVCLTNVHVSTIIDNVGLDMRNLSLGRCHLVNAYEVEAGIGVIAGNTCLSAMSVRYYKKCAM